MTYDPTTPPVRQTDSWSCSIASTAWMLHSVGLAVGYPASLEAEMRADGLVSTQLGLEDGSGGQLADWLEAEYGLETDQTPSVSWDWLQDHAGTMPIAMGSGTLYHWVTVRGVDGEGNLTLANPAPGYRGLGDTMTEAQFRQWMPWASVWIVSEEAEDVDCSEYINLLGYLQGDVATALQDALDSARVAKTAAARMDAYNALQAAIWTLQRGGAAA